MYKKSTIATVLKVIAIVAAVIVLIVSFISFMEHIEDSKEYNDDFSAAEYFFTSFLPSLLSSLTFFGILFGIGVIIDQNHTLIMQSHTAGMPMGGTPTPAPMHMSRPVPQPQPTPPAEPGSIVCPVCGTRQSAMNQVCPSCATRLR